MSKTQTIVAAAQGVDLRRYVAMTKPTITLLVVVTVVPALLLAGPGLPSMALAIATLLGTYLASASASVFNHLLDSDIDERMARTRGRPVPSGQVSRPAAFVFASALGVASLVVLQVFTTPLAAAVAFAANAFYVLIYTLILKRHTDQNIVIGGAAGAVGPLIGWAAASGSLEWPAWVLFLVIFLWTPPHFWALALKYKGDYAKAGVPMLPVTKGEDATRRWIFLYALTLIPCVASLTIAGRAGLVYLGLAGGATLWFVLKAYRLYVTRDDRLAMPVFHASCLYLFVVFGALTLDAALLAL